MPQILPFDGKAANRVTLWGAGSKLDMGDHGGLFARAAPVRKEVSTSEQAIADGGLSTASSNVRTMSSQPGQRVNAHSRITKDCRQVDEYSVLGRGGGRTPLISSDGSPPQVARGPKNIAAFSAFAVAARRCTVAALELEFVVQGAFKLAHLVSESAGRLAELRNNRGPSYIRRLMWRNPNGPQCLSNRV